MRSVNAVIPEKKVMLQSPAIKPARNLYLQLLSPQSISIILSALFCLLISLLFFARGTTQALPATVSSTPPAVIHTDPRAVIHADPPAPLQGSPTTAAIVQRTLPAPIYPFPRDVRQQVGVLERYHRFFFGGKGNVGLWHQIPEGNRGKTSRHERHRPKRPHRPPL